MGPDLFYRSKKLGYSVSYYDIPDLTDQELTKFYHELCAEKTAVSAQLSIYKNLEPLSEAQGVSFIKGLKKKKIVEGFYKEVKWELKKKFIQSHSIKENEFRTLCADFERLTNSQKKFQRTFISLLEETYGEDQIRELQQKAQECITLKLISC